ncbi:MAG: YsnF/AvaK domain-containing protein [Candidatus Xenobia bacterium]
MCESFSIVGRDGVLGRATAVGPEQAELLLTLEDGTELLLPRALLTENPDGTWQAPLSRSDLAARGSERPLVVPVMQEELQVSRRRIPTARVRITKAVTTRTEVVDQPLMREDVEVERVSLGHVIQDPPPIRYEGDTLVVPLLEEMLVIEKRLVVREELHIRRRHREVREPQQVLLRRESAEVERLDS